MVLLIAYDAVCLDCGGPLQPRDKVAAGHPDRNALNFTAAVSCADCGRQTAVTGCLQQVNVPQTDPNPETSPRPY